MISLDTASRIAEVYSKTLFELAAQQQSIDLVKDDLDTVELLIAAESSFLTFMKSPYFSFEQKQLLIEKTFSGNVNNLAFNFLMVVVSHDRTAFLPYIIEKYDKLYKHHHNYLDIHVTLSQALEQNGIQTLKTALSAAMNNDRIILETTVDPSIIGGAIIHYNGVVIDNSVRSRLHRAIDTIISQGRNQEKVYEA